MARVRTSLPFAALVRMSACNRMIVLLGIEHATHDVFHF